MPPNVHCTISILISIGKFENTLIGQTGFITLIINDKILVENHHLRALRLHNCGLVDYDCMFYDVSNQPQVSVRRIGFVITIK